MLASFSMPVSSRHSPLNHIILLTDRLTEWKNLSRAVTQLYPPSWSCKLLIAKFASPSLHHCTTRSPWVSVKVFLCSADIFRNCNSAANFSHDAANIASSFITSYWAKQMRRCKPLYLQNSTKMWPYLYTNLQIDHIILQFFMPWRFLLSSNHTAMLTLDDMTKVV